MAAQRAWSCTLTGSGVTWVSPDDVSSELFGIKCSPILLPAGGVGPSSWFKAVKLIRKLLQIEFP